MSLIKLINFEIKSDGRGDLVAFEGFKNVPFEIKRVYFIKNVKDNIPRGFHAHRKLKQVAICLSGSCRMVLDDGRNREDFWLNSCTFGIYIDNMTWREMHNFSSDCVLLVFASEYFDENDYIRDYNHFLKLQE